MAPNEDDVLLAGDVSSRDDADTPILEPKNQHLTCFAGGMFGIAGKIFDNPEDVDVGRKLTDGCLWAYESSPHGIMPEIISTVPCKTDSECLWDEKLWQAEVGQQNGEEEPSWKKLVETYHLAEGVTQIQDTRYILRPEAIESIFIMYRITGDESYRERAWHMFEAIIKLTETKIAHAGLDDCVADRPAKMDRMEPFWMAETLKYFYLLYSDPEVISFDEYVLNTEAHPLRRPN